MAKLAIVMICVYTYYWYSRKVITIEIVLSPNQFRILPWK